MAIVPTDKDLTLLAFMQRFSTPASCLKHLEAIRWREGAFCPKCAFVGQMDRLRDGKYFKCPACKKLFMMMTDTMFGGDPLLSSGWAMPCVCRPNRNRTRHRSPGNRPCPAGLYADTYHAYACFASDYSLHRVNHSRGEYVREGVPINTVESLWASLKRISYGIHHHWSFKHMQRYINRVLFRINQ